MSNNGVDNAERDQQLSDVLVACLEAIDQGRPLDPQEWLDRYPEFAPELARLIEGQQHLGRLTGPLCASWRAPVDTPPAGQTPPPGAGAAGEAGLRWPGLPGVFGDYELLRELGSGGMGVVYEARQRSLQRIVALKMLRSDRLVSTADRQRFQAEAEAVAALDHPHLVPIHEVGELEGQAYFTMKLVRGGNLAQRLPDFVTDHRAAAQLLVRVARAVHHAHQRGVLHRDLKPSNILLDSDGSPYVTDFGLAKRLESGADLTQSGAIVGTPGYMAPEQATGKKGTVTTAADVYGLGAVLYALLTGRPPFTGETPLDTLTKVREQEPEAPSKTNPRVHRDLEAICLKCLEKEPQRRYVSAEILADDLERWLKGESIHARPVGRLARVQRWCRRKPGLAGLTGATILLLLLLIAGSLWEWSRAVRQRNESSAQWAETERTVAGYLQQAALLQEQNRWAEAAQVLARAEERLPGGGPDRLLEQVRRRRDEADWIAELEEARLCAAEAGTDHDSFNNAGADRAYQEAFTRRGLDFGALGPDEAAVRIRTSAVRARLVEALDDWAHVKENLRPGSGEELRALADRTDDDPWRQRLRQLTTRKDWAALEQLAAEEGAIAQPPANLVLLSFALEATGRKAAPAERLLRRAQQLHPGDFWTNFELGHFLAPARNVGPSARTEEAIGFYRAALAVRPQSPAVLNNLGHALAAQGKLAEAEAAFRKAIDLKPDFSLAHSNLGVALEDQGKLAEAEAACRKAIDLRSEDPRPHYNLGNALGKQGKLAEAEAALRKAIALRPDYAEAHGSLGVVLYKQGKPTEAEAALRRAIDLRPDDPLTYTNLGNALEDQGKLAEAEAAHRKAIALGPDDPGAYTNLGNALALQGKLAEAEAAHRKAIALRPNHPEAHANLGNALADQGKPAEAEAAYRKAIALRPDFPNAHYSLGIALNAQGKPVEAEAAYRKAIDLKPDFAAPYVNLAEVLRVQGKLAEAEEACRQVITLQPDLPEAYGNLGLALRDQGHFADALAALKRCHALGSRNPRWHYPSAQMVEQCERLVQLDAKLSAMLSGKDQPTDAAERIALAELCQMPCKKRYAAAARFYDEAFTAEPKRAGDRPSDARYNAACAAALAGCGQGNDADTLDTTARARLRQQALDWLRADLAAWHKALAGDRSKAAPAVREQMHHWLQDADFAGVRGPQALAKLPEAERSAWEKLWADVEELFVQAGGRTSGPEK
jgi:serine/threonine-protein kinase